MNIDRTAVHTLLDVILDEVDRQAPMAPNGIHIQAGGGCLFSMIFVAGGNCNSVVDAIAQIGVHAMVNTLSAHAKVVELPKLTAGEVREQMVAKMARKPPSTN